MPTKTHRLHLKLVTCMQIGQRTVQCPIILNVFKWKIIIIIFSFSKITPAINLHSWMAVKTIACENLTLSDVIPLQQMYIIIGNHYTIVWSLSASQKRTEITLNMFPVNFVCSMELLIKGKRLSGSLITNTLILSSNM